MNLLPLELNKGSESALFQSLNVTWLLMQTLNADSQCRLSMLPDSQCYQTLNVTRLSMLPDSQCRLLMQTLNVTRLLQTLNVTRLSMQTLNADSQCYQTLADSQCYQALNADSQCYQRRTFFIALDQFLAIQIPPETFFSTKKRFLELQHCNRERKSGTAGELLRKPRNMQRR